MTDLRGIIREIYNREIDRKSNLNTSISIQIGLVSLLIGGIYAVIKSVNHEPKFIFHFEVFFTILSALFAAASVVFLIISNWSMEYKYIPYAQGLLDYNEKMREHFKRERNQKARAEEEVLIHLHKEYAACADHNARIHKKISDNLHLQKITFIASIVFLSISALPISYLKIISNDNIQRVEIVNLKELNVTNNKTISSGTNTPPPPPPPPSPPPSRQERGAVVPPPPPPQPSPKRK